MKNFKLSFLFALLPFLLFSCTTTTITPYKSEKIKGPFKKIYIFINGMLQSEEFIEGFSSRIKDDFAKRNLSLEIYTTASLGRETMDDIKRIQDYQPDAILIMRQTSNTMSKDGSGSSTFDLKLFEKKLDKLVWQASMKAHSDMGISKTVDKIANSFILKLEKEKIIPKGINATL